MTAPTDVVLDYFDRVRRRDVRVADLFAVDARLVGLGTVVEGRDAITEFNRETIEQAGPTHTVVRPDCDVRSCDPWSLRDNFRITPGWFLSHAVT